MKKLVLSISLALSVYVVFVVSAFAAPPSPGDLVINEVMQNPAAVTDANGEWFEIKNVSGTTLDLDNCVISDTGSNSFTVAGGTSIGVDEHFVFCINDTTSTNGGLPTCYDWGTTGNFQLTNGDDEIIITYGGQEIDRIDYDGGSDWPDPTGASMAYNVPDSGDTSNNIGANWADSEEPPQSSTYGSGDYGTPGARNHDWMDGQDGRPNTITLRSFSASARPFAWSLAAPVATAAALTLAGLLWARRRRLL